MQRLLKGDQRLLRLPGQHEYIAGVDLGFDQFRFDFQRATVAGEGRLHSAQSDEGISAVIQDARGAGRAKAQHPFERLQRLLEPSDFRQSGRPA